MPTCAAVLALALMLASPLAAQPALSTFGGMGLATITDVAVGARGETVVTGDFRETVDFDPGPGTASRTGVSNEGDVFVARYDESSAFISVVTFAASFKTSGASVAVDANGDAVVAGHFKGSADFDPSPTWVVRTSTGRDGDVFVARYSAAGAFVSVVTISGTTGGPGLDVTVGASGQAVVTGSFNATSDFDPGPATVNRTSSGGNAFVARYSADGAFVSVATVGGAGFSSGTDIEVDASGHAVVTGLFTGTAVFDPRPGVEGRVSSGASDVFVARYASDGAFVSVVTFGGTGSDSGSGIALDAGGQAVVTGRFTGTVDFDPGPGTAQRTSSGDNDAFVARYAPSGALIWVVTFGGGLSDSGSGIALDADGHAAVTGSFSHIVDFDPGLGTARRTSAHGEDAFVARYASDGTFVSVVTFGGKNSDFGRDVAVDQNGTAVVTGAFSSTVDFDPGPGVASRTSPGIGVSLHDAFLARYRATGALLSVVTLGGMGSARSTGIALDPRGQSVVVGTFSGVVDFDPGPGVVNRTSADSADVFVARYTVAGALVSVTALRGTRIGEGPAVAVDANGHAVVAGTFYGTVDFDDGPGTEQRTSEGGEDVFVARYASDGAFVSVVTFGGLYRNVGYDVVVDARGHAVVTGAFYGTADFDPGPGEVLRRGTGYEDMFVARYSAEGALVSVVTVGGAYSTVGRRVAVSASGESVVTGSFMGTVDFDPGPGVVSGESINSRNPAVFVARYTANGALVSLVVLKSQQDYLGSTTSTDIALDARGQAIVTGTYSATVDFDPGPGTANRTSDYLYNGFVARYTADGTFISVVTLGGRIVTPAVAVDTNGEAVVTGMFDGTIDFDPGPGTVRRTNNGGGDVFVARYSAEGALISVGTTQTWVNNPSGTGSTGVAVDASGHAVVTGFYNGTVNFSPGEGTVLRVNTGARDDVFVARYTAAGELVMGTNTSVADDEDVPDVSDLRVSGMAPNPTRGASHLRIEVASPQRVTVGMYDVLGRRVVRVFEGTVSAGTAETVTVETVGLPAGLYVVRVEGERFTTARTLVVVR